MPTLGWRLLDDELDRVRSHLERVGQMRRQARQMTLEAACALEAAVIEAEQWLGVTEIAPLAGVSRQAIYAILAELAAELD
jgi:hypothetical protein